MKLSPQTGDEIEKQSSATAALSSRSHDAARCGKKLLTIHSWHAFFEQPVFIKMGSFALHFPNMMILQ